MNWKRVGKKRSGDMIDVRGAKPARGGSGGSGGGGGGGKLGGGAGGFDLGQVLGAGAAPPSADDPEPLDPSEDPDADLKDFSTYVFVDAQDTWREAFKAGGDRYRNAELVLYSDAVNTGGCGSASSAVGPFYCPGDSRVYLDLTFYEDMERQLGASTVFAEGDLEPGDIDEAFGAAESVGDDRIQEQATGKVNPDSFTHGTSEQRRKWFTTGYESGDPAACDTFSPDSV